MKWVYGIAVLLAALQLIVGEVGSVSPNRAAGVALVEAVEILASESGVPNAVTGLILRNRLYDTVFEVVVFSTAILGAQYLLADEQPTANVAQFTDIPSIVLARVGATISALIAVELAIRGHLTPGGGFAAGVAGGTAIGLVAITASSTWMEAIYKRWRAAMWEKLSVVTFIGVAVVALAGWELPRGELGALFSGGWIPILNILVAIKVALGSWAAVLIFIRYRGLL
ncbi:transporter, cation:proton antiporter family [Synechococcus sp. JA-2-3B'a(2-13)]|uniref:Na(+)/H(+) antiporter subunit B n=1 Tax=Synechococcus sp. (strain JA-2-3B'a(2-13)) TaxID=321332 RepID=UPI0000694A3B|nr:Na(+)/H(+) antiporter subunit B [Synechococcus sp. JA-2-3B'a(2-13)]ABD01212.1 transporter, cation:proton antiporter family [Synechococcus sp. JA-2-3B'a(2-13)]